MRWILAGVMVAASTLSCTAAERETAAKPQDCNVRASAPWTVAGAGFMAEAMSDGPSCAQAVLTLVVRDPSGKPLWTDARVAAQLMTFQEAKDKASMATALADWIDQADSTMKKSESLPPWDHDQQTPENGEFPFMLEEGVDRELYEKYRRADGPLFCYVQGMESLACVILDKETGEMSKVGLQTFPG